MSQVKHNLEKVAQELGDTMLGHLNGLIEGGVKSIQGPVRDIANNMAFAARRGDQALVQACKDQMVLVLEKHKIQAKAKSEGALYGFATTGIEMLVNGASVGLRGLIVTP